MKDLRPLVCLKDHRVAIHGKSHRQHERNPIDDHSKPTEALGGHPSQAFVPSQLLKLPPWSIENPLRGRGETPLRECICESAPRVLASLTGIHGLETAPRRLIRTLRP